MNRDMIYSTIEKQIVYYKNKKSEIDQQIKRKRWQQILEDIWYGEMIPLSKRGKKEHAILKWSLTSANGIPNSIPSKIGWLQELEREWFDVDLLKNKKDHSFKYNLYSLIVNSEISKNEAGEMFFDDKKLYETSSGFFLEDNSDKKIELDSFGGVIYDLCNIKMQIKQKRDYIDNHKTLFSNKLEQYYAMSPFNGWER